MLLIYLRSHRKRKVRIHHWCSHDEGYLAIIPLLRRHTGIVLVLSMHFLILSLILILVGLGEGQDLTEQKHTTVIVIVLVQETVRCWWLKHLRQIATLICRWAISDVIQVLLLGLTLSHVERVVWKITVVIEPEKIIKAALPSLKRIHSRVVVVLF